MKCNCSKEAEIAEIHTVVLRLDKRLSGREGLIAEFDQLKGGMKLIAAVGIGGFITGILAFLKVMLH